MLLFWVHTCVCVCVCVCVMLCEALWMCAVRACVHVFAGANDAFDGSFSVFYDLITQTG